LARKTKKIREIKKTEEKVNRDEIKKKITYSKYVILAVAIVIAVIALIVNLSLILGTQTSVDGGTKPPVVSGLTQTSSYCEKNSECFVVGCKSGTILECVNTSQMNNYYKNCESVWDLKVEVQNPSNCGCIQNKCRAP